MYAPIASMLQSWVAKSKSCRIWSRSCRTTRCTRVISTRTIKLHVMRGSFFTPDDGAAMDVDVWGRLPEDLIWKVLQLVPAATWFQLQLVSCKWRQVLTSANFRRKRPIELASCQSEKKRHRVVAVRSRAIMMPKTSMWWTLSRTCLCGCQIAFGNPTPTLWWWWRQRTASYASPTQTGNPATIACSTCWHTLAYAMEFSYYILTWKYNLLSVYVSLLFTLTFVWNRLLLFKHLAPKKFLIQQF